MNDQAGAAGPAERERERARERDTPRRAVLYTLWDGPPRWAGKWLKLHLPALSKAHRQVE